jgi:hypothetical protein
MRVVFDRMRRSIDASAPSTLAARQRDWLLAIVLALAVAVASWIVLPAGGYDWYWAFGPAARHWRPAPWLYDLPYLPWAALILAPLGALSDRLATAIVNAGSVLAMVAILRRYGGQAWLAVPLVLSPFAFQMFDLGQADLLILAGLLLSNGLDLIVIVIKPQVAAGAIAARLSRAGRRHVLAYVAPLIALSLVSLAIWPGWPAALLQTSREHQAVSWNVAPWPWGVPLGLALLWRAWRHGDDAAGVIATPLLVPFINAQTLLAPLVIVAARWPRWFLVAWCAAWGLVGYLVIAGPIPRPIYIGGVAVAIGAAMWASWRRRARLRRRASANTLE